MVTDVLIAVSAGLGGILCGWYAYPAFSPSDAEGENDGEHGESAQAEEHARLQEVADRLRSLTEGVAADVGAHQSQIQKIADLMRSEAALHQPGVLVDTIHRLLDASDGLRGQLDQAKHQLREQAVQLQTAEQRALTDQLTQVANRRALDMHLDEIVATTPPCVATMMLVDVDHFKHFNDTHGHLAGDEVLQQVGQLLKQECGPDALAARYGGEEFAVVWKDTDLDTAARLAEALRESIGSLEIPFQGTTLKVTASAGLAPWRPGDSGEFWIERTDRALYAAKDAGRNCGFAMRGETPFRLTSAKKSSSVATDSTTGSPEPPRAAPATVTFAAPEDLPRSLEGLPTGTDILAEFSELAASVQGVGVAFVTALVRLDPPEVTPEDLRTLARTLRSMIRSADRIGLMNERTVVIAMPHIDHETAALRAERIRSGIGYAFQIADSATPTTVSISLCSNREHPTFEAMVGVAARNLERACESGGSQLVTSWKAASTRSR